MGWSLGDSKQFWKRDSVPLSFPAILSYSVKIFLLLCATWLFVLEIFQSLLSYS